jgi:two-component sensor histidine kinase
MAFASVDLTIIPPDEPSRMAAVRRYEILDTPPDGAFDHITAIAARNFNVPISIISIVDEDRIWFKSRHGLDVEQIGRDPGLCASAVLSAEPWIIADAKEDIRSLANPLVAGDFGLRFYVGVPLRTSDGYNLGTLCVIDKEPRTINERQIEDLKDLAAVVMDQMELRLSARRAVGQAQIMSREIDHRVMNSLQFVSALLTIQGRASGNPAVSSQLESAANRVRAVARVHQHFYKGEPTERVGCLTYLGRLCADLSDILQVKIDVSGTETNVSTRQIQPIGLVVNELVINAAKHGAGKIKVALAPGPSDVCSLSVSDEGEGLPAGFDPNQISNGLGMKLVSILSRQLGGSVIAGPNPAGPGACFTVTFMPSAP